MSRFFAALLAAIHGFLTEQREQRVVDVTPERLLFASPRLRQIW
jgi:hypothetical protein